MEEIHNLRVKLQAMEDKSQLMSTNSKQMDKSNLGEVDSAYQKVF